jgi:hypothetical protein
MVVRLVALGGELVFLHNLQRCNGRREDEDRSPHPAGQPQLPSRHRCSQVGRPKEDAQHPPPSSHPSRHQVGMASPKQGSGQRRSCGQCWAAQHTHKASVREQALYSKLMLLQTGGKEQKAALNAEVSGTLSHQDTTCTAGQAVPSSCPC